MEFTPQDMSVKTLFKTYPTFNIPIFQRDYSWDRPFYNKFIEDIVNGIKKESGALKTQFTL